MLGEAVVAQNFARELQKEGIYVTGFFYPVVPKARRVFAPRCRRRIP
jgi:glycine C-acetyltransferase